MRYMLRVDDYHTWDFRLVLPPVYTQQPLSTTHTPIAYHQLRMSFALSERTILYAIV